MCGSFILLRTISSHFRIKEHPVLRLGKKFKIKEPSDFVLLEIFNFQNQRTFDFVLLKIFRIKEHLLVLIQFSTLGTCV
jgi:hypothetical protein